MKHKVQMLDFNTAHMIATCKTCNWKKQIRWANRVDFPHLRREARKHVEETGHTVEVEAIRYSEYSVAQD